MKNALKCLLGLHYYEVIKEEDVKQIGTDIVIGKVLVTRCANCGKIKKIDIKTIGNIYIG